MANKKPYVSPSQINMYCRCPQQYYFRYIKKIVSPPGIALIKGTSIHKGSEHNFKQKIESHKDLRRNEIVDVSVATMETVIKNEGLSLSQEEELVGKKNVIGVAKDDVVKMAKTLWREVCPLYQPTDVEKEVVISLDNSSHDLKGIIDLMTDKETMDIKTSGKAWSQSKLDNDIQMKFYGLMRMALEGSNLPVAVENITNTGKRARLEKLFTTGEYERLVNRINKVIDGIKQQSFPPCHQDNFLCNRKFCGYFDICEVRP